MAGSYFCLVNSFLYNPVFDALQTGDRSLSFGSDKVKYFDADVSPFVGIETGYPNGFADLEEQLPAGRLILHATPEDISTPAGFTLLHKIPGIQMLLTDLYHPQPSTLQAVSLTNEHVPQMVELATLTRPGPFGTKTILFGNYQGIFVDGRLAAMTGQRLHPNTFTEISAVCTHPDFLGRGFAAALVQQQAEAILAQGQKAFLHVRKDNYRAITLYERLGFAYSGDMNFYFMKRND
ncbi:MAG: GNAT family N-acetyltransferase [Chitinophagaceae bacterium]|nr:MAG: GNAT family N-acetyltransferase [Chitinophagaceae bacterium]